MLKTIFAAAFVAVAALAAGSFMKPAAAGPVPMKNLSLVSEKGSQLVADNKEFFGHHGHHGHFGHHGHRGHHGHFGHHGHHGHHGWVN